MPHITIKMFPGRNAQQKSDLAKKTQDFVAQELDLDHQFVTVSIEDVDKGDWANEMKAIPKGTMFAE